MLNRKHVPWMGFVVCGFAITALAQAPVSPRQTPGEPQVQGLIQRGTDALEIGDASQARVAFGQLLELGRENRRLDLLWQAEHGLGRAALAAHDPAVAIEHLEQSVGDYEQSGDRSAAAPYRSLAAALMMQSSSPVDHFIERAFDVAQRARADRPESLPSRAELTAAMRPGDMVVAFLIGDGNAHAWALNRDTLLGYPLPSPAEITTAVERINAYVAQQDRAGVERIADDLMPALLGPVIDRLPTLRRVIFVMDGPLKQLSIGELPVAGAASRLSQQLAVSIVDDGSLLEEIRRPPSSAPPALMAWPTSVLAAIGLAVAILILGFVAARRRRSSVP
jgi:hypothetical protein